MTCIPCYFDSDLYWLILTLFVVSLANVIYDNIIHVLYLENNIY